MCAARSDGVWDTLDAVQNGTPRQFSLNHDSWAKLNEREVQRIVPLVGLSKHHAPDFDAFAVAQ